MNLKALMAAHPELNRLPALTKRSGVSNGTLDRTRRAASAINVDDLERIAEAFGLSAWQLLVPDLDPQAPSQLATPTRERTVARMLLVAEELAKFKATGD